MKKGIITAAILSAFLIGCKDNTSSQEDSSITTEMAQKESLEVLDNSWVETIKLEKDGNKWEANQETNEGVEKMISLIKETEAHSIEDYHTLAANLNEVKNYIVKECTMDGPSHDNLHIFLHPLIEKINALDKASTVKEGEIIKESILENLVAYYKFFK